MDKNDVLPETAAGEDTPVLPAVKNDPPPMPEVAPAKQPPALDTVDVWFNEFFHNSLVSRDAQIFNYCQSAKEELKRRLAAL